MANATAAQAYAAVQALETEMKTTNGKGYSLKVPLEAATAKIIADNVGVDTFDEAYTGILLAASTATTAAELTDGTGVGMYKAEGGYEPQPGTDILFIVNGGTYVTSLAI